MALNCSQNKVDIALLIDSTASIETADNFRLGLKFIRDFLYKLNISPDNTRVAAAMYGNEVYQKSAFDFNKYGNKKQLLDAITGLKWMHGTETKTGEGITYMVDEFLPRMRPDAAKVGIVITDGQSQDKKATAAAAKRAGDRGLTMIAVGIVYRQLPVDIALLIDSTASIGSQKYFTLGIEFIQEIIRDFDMKPNSTRFGAVMFGDRVYKESVIPFGYERNKADTIAALSNLKWMQGNSTQTGLGIEYIARNFLFRPEAAKVGVVITDGQSQNRKKTERAADHARNKNIYMIAIGVGKEADDTSQPKNGEYNMEELVAIAGREDFVLTVGDYTKLLQIKNHLLNIFCVRIAEYASMSGSRAWSRPRYVK
ncbi:hypothetical protein Btru_020778 [Bulinus truncatus]|nr:hypothetical protein Btru_020778 [Bulinus truncatus]